MKKVLVPLFWMFGSALQAVPGIDVEFTYFPAQNSRSNALWSPVLQDIVNHEAPDDHNPYDDLVTLGHETSHGIHAYLRNRVAPKDRKYNGFYVLNDKAVIVAEPNIRISQIAAFVPASLRGTRFQLYFEGQMEWDDTPLYIWDEWNSYVNGGATGVDLVQHNLWKGGWRDAVAGPLEFAVYAIATAMAVEAHDPDYLKDGRQFKEFLAWNLQRTMEAFRPGSEMVDFRYDVQDKYYENWKSSPDAEKLREFTRVFWNKEWVNEVLGY